MVRKLHNGGNGKCSLQAQMAPRTTDSTADWLSDCTMLQTTFSVKREKGGMSKNGVSNKVACKFSSHRELFGESQRANTQAVTDIMPTTAESQKRPSLPLRWMASHCAKLVDYQDRDPKTVNHSITNQKNWKLTKNTTQQWTLMNIKEHSIQSTPPPSHTKVPLISCQLQSQLPVNGGGDSYWKRPDFPLWRARDLDLTLDRVILHTVVHHSSTSTYIPNITEIKEAFCGRMNVRMCIRTYAVHICTDGQRDRHLRSA